MKGILKSWTAALAITVMASGAVVAQQAAAVTQPANDEATKTAYITQGEVVYNDYCAACHGVSGEGGGGPALAKNGFVKGRAAVINQILFGASDHGMPPFAPELTDEQIAQVATYIRNTWGNEAGVVLPRSVELRRTTPK